MSAFAPLPPSARLWLFAFEGDVPAGLLADVRAFCTGWTSHGRPVQAAADTLAGPVLAVAATITDAEANAGVSGCGIDAMQHAVETAAERHGSRLAPALAVTYRDAGGEWQTVPRAAFRHLVREGAAGPETRVLDLTPATLRALNEAGGVERAAGEAWHGLVFGLTTVSGA